MRRHLLHLPFVAALGILLLSCGGDEFKRPDVCLTCPLPPTKPPVLTWIVPTLGGTVTNATLLTVGVTDDRQVIGVEFWYYDLKILPGMDGSAPYQAELGKYLAPSLPTCPVAITLTAIAFDVEGNADTVPIGVNYSPPPGVVCHPAPPAGVRSADPPPAAAVPGRSRR